MKFRLSKLALLPWNSIGSFVAIAAAAGLVGTSLWLSMEFIKDPRSVAWMNRFLPANAKIAIAGWDDPKTLREIEADLKKAGAIAGEPIRTETTTASGQKTTDLLIPIFNRDRLIELRAYRLVQNPIARKKEVLQFVNQLTVRDLQEGFVTEPLVRVKAAPPGSDRTLPLVEVRRDDRAPNNGVWLTLSGTLRQGDTALTYGQVIYYNPITTALKVMLPWTSTAGLPGWQAVPKGRTAEIVVDQTVGLEPSFQTYQLRSIQHKHIPFQLQPISLTQSAIDNGAFVDALMLARSGLWSTALEFMQSVKRRSPTAWTPAAQAQLDLVARHAKVSQAQAEQPWATVSQQVLANLLDGRWQRSAQFISSERDRADVLELLKLDSGRIYSRINAALQVDPGRWDVQTWAALRLVAKQGKPSAIAWLVKQPQVSSVRRAQTLKLLNQFDPVLSDAPTPTPSTTVSQSGRN